MHPLRPSGRLPKDHPVDQQRAACRPPALSGRRVPGGPSRETPQRRPKPRGRDVGARTVSHRFWPAAAAAAAGIQVGSAMVATRLVVDQAGPASLALVRYVLGVSCLLPAMLLTRSHARFAPRDVMPIALLGVTQFGILIALLNYGLRSVPAARAALIFATFPLLTSLVAAALGRERLTWSKMTGVLLTILGVGLALGEKTLSRGAGDPMWLR